MLSEKNLPTDSSRPVSGTGILCGTDFSAGALQAAKVAAELARCLIEPLILLHAVRDPPQQDLSAESRESRIHEARDRLLEQQERVRLAHGELPSGLVLAGLPEAVVLEQVVAHQPRLLVLGGTNGSLPLRLNGETIAERIAESAQVPALVVRDAEPLVRWIRGSHTLRVFIAADLSTPSEVALRWVNWLRKVASCEILVSYLQTGDAPPANGEVVPSLFLGEMVLKSAHLPERQFGELIRKVFGPSYVRARCEKCRGDLPAHLLRLAADHRADLVVIGTHSRHGWHRLGHHSISRSVLREVSLNVACVPAIEARFD